MKKIFTLDRRRFLTTLATTSPLLGLHTPVDAQTWPARAIRVVVPFPPGGGTDIAARIIVERLAIKLGQPVVIDNKPGASTAIGALAVAHAEPDGYTLLLSGSSTFTVNPAVRPKLNYDPFKQFTPLAMVARAPLVLLTGAQSPYPTLDALMAAATQKPGDINYATFGAGSGPHLAAEMLAYAKGVKLGAVPYKGSAESTIGLIRGDVALGIDTLAAAAPQIQAGKLRALAVISEKRSSLLPKVPGYGELGLSSALFDAWYAVAAPAHLSAPAQAKLLQALQEIMAEPQVRSKLAQQSMEAVISGPHELKATMDQEVVRYRAIVARANIRIDA
jgi:tripartite-type tricarboxylate transporter receptor subunit TctC